MQMVLRIAMDIEIVRTTMTAMNYGDDILKINMMVIIPILMITLIIMEEMPTIKFTKRIIIIMFINTNGNIELE